MNFDNISKTELSALSLKIYGASHDEKIGVECSGLPEGEKIDLDELSSFMQRRAPGRSKTSTPRKEADLPVFVSGLCGDTLTGDLCAEIYNTNKKSSDYSSLAFIPRPGHADYPARVRFGSEYDLSGGGHFSGRMTAPLCIAGGIALQLLRKRGIHVGAHAERIASVCDRRFSPLDGTLDDILLLNERAKQDGILTFSDEVSASMEREILSAAEAGDSVGGIIECAATGLCPGLGQHMFDSVEHVISRLAFAVPAVKGIEFGEGFGVASLRGSQNNDGYRYSDGNIKTISNHAGGILGGMTNGAPVIFRVAIKPTPSVFTEQESVDMVSGENVSLCIKGRHDPCIVGRAIPVIEAVCALSLLDIILENERRHKNC